MFMMLSIALSSSIFRNFSYPICAELEDLPYLLWYMDQSTGLPISVLLGIKYNLVVIQPITSWCEYLLSTSPIWLTLVRPEHPNY